MNRYSKFIILVIMLVLVPVRTLAHELDGAEAKATTNKTNAIKRSVRHQKTSPGVKQSADLCVCKFGSERQLSITYRLRKIGTPKSQECAWLVIDPKGVPMLWVKSLGNDHTDKNMTKLNAKKAAELFGTPYCSTGAYNLIGWRGDGDPEIFHIHLGFSPGGFCDRYRIRGPAVRAVWIQFDKKSGERTVFPQHSGNVDKNYSSCLAETGYHQRVHKIKKESIPLADPNVPNFK